MVKLVGPRQRAANLINIIPNRTFMGTIGIIGTLFGAALNANAMHLPDLPSAKIGGSDVANSSLNVTRFAEQGLVSQKNDELSKRLAPTITSYIRWIIGKTGWSISDAPPIQKVSRAQLGQMFFGAEEAIVGIEPLALYSRDRHVIYLTDTWNSDQLLDRSILLHELVHHLQVMNGVKLACQTKYEAQAYQLQISWLIEQGVQDPLIHPL